MKKSIILCAIAYLSTAAIAQNVGVGTSSPSTKLDINGAIRMEETALTISSNAATIPSNVGQVQLTTGATGTVTLSGPTSAYSGQQLVIYNNCGYAATFTGASSASIPTGVAMEFIYSNSIWLPVSPAQGGSGYILNQATQQASSSFNISGTGEIGTTAIIGTGEAGSSPTGGTLRGPNAGAGTNTPGGALNINGGYAYGSGLGGAVNITGGTTGTGANGSVTINPGTTTTPGSTAGSVTINGTASGSGTYGSTYINPSGGSIQLGSATGVAYLSTGVLGTASTAQLGGYWTQVGGGNLNIYSNNNSGTGWVGIGTNGAPSAQLDVASTSFDVEQIDGSNTIGAAIKLNPTGSGGKTWELFATASAAGEGADRFVIKDDNANDRLLIDNSGNIVVGYGDGTGSPVGNTLRAPSNGSSGVGGSLSIAGGNGAGAGNGGHVYVSGGANGSSGTNGNVYVRAGSSSVTNSAGNVYINDYSNAGSIYGNTIVNPSGGSIQLGNQTGIPYLTGGVLSIAAAGTNYQAPITAGAGLYYSTTNTLASYWTASGNNIYNNNNSGAGFVGIGTNGTPASILHVKTSGATFATIDGGSGSQEGFNFYVNGSGRTNLYFDPNGTTYNSNGALLINNYGSSTPDVVINQQGGSVGIGVVKPLSALEVSTFNTTNSTIKTGALELQSFALNNSWYGENTYYNSVFKYRAAGYASVMYMLNGAINFNTAPSGSAGATAPMVTRLGISNTGQLSLGSTPVVASNSTNGAPYTLTSTDIASGIWYSRDFALPSTVTLPIITTPSLVQGQIMIIYNASNSTNALTVNFPTINQSGSSGTPSVTISRGTGQMFMYMSAIYTNATNSSGATGSSGGWFPLN
jgi:hypothetical protein